MKTNSSQSRKKKIPKSILIAIIGGLVAIICTYIKVTGSLNKEAKVQPDSIQSHSVILVNDKGANQNGTINTNQTVYEK